VLYESVSAPTVSRIDMTPAPRARRLRVAHLYSADFGIRSCLPFVAPLRARDWQVTFITPDGPDVALAASLGHRWLPLPLTRRMDLASDLRGAAALAALLARERFDIVHTHNIKVGMVARVLAGLLRAPIVVHTVHGTQWSSETPQPARAVNILLERIAGLAADLLFAQSETDRDTLVTSRVAPPERIRVIGNGIDLARFDPARVSAEARARLRAVLGVADDECLVVFPGRMVREKGIEEVFAAARLLRGQKVRIALAGRDDSERGDLPAADIVREGRADALVLGERDDMPELYAASDIVGLASWREGMPRALMEAAAMERPVVATDTRGCRDVVRPGVTGELVPLRDPPALAAALLALAGDPLRRARMGERGRREALARFDIHAAVERVIAAYDELIAKKGVA